MRPAVLAQLRKGVLEYCVLAEVKRKPSYGLALAARLSAESLLFDRVGVIYPLLARMRELGWVETYWEESVAGPPRRYYRISVAGDEALAAFQQSWRPFVRAASEILERGSNG